MDEKKKGAAWHGVSYRPFSQNAVPGLWSVASDTLEELDLRLTRRGQKKKKAAVNTHSRKGQSQDCKVVEKCSAEPQDGRQGSGGT